MRTKAISVGEYYHIYNRANDGQEIFLDDRDWARFLFALLHFQSPIVFDNPSRMTNRFIRTRNFGVDEGTVKDIIREKTVSIVNFCIMKNHFHLTLRETHERGIAKYMHRILTAYTKYFNTKYQKSGHLFQGPYQYVHVEDNDQLLYLSTYIHRNPRGYKKWRDKENEYFYSSTQDYVKENRWGDLIEPSIILNQFKSKDKYEKFVTSSVAKLDEYEKILID